MTTSLDLSAEMGTEFEEVFEHFLVESGCVPAGHVAAAWQARWREPQRMAAAALASHMLTADETAATLQLQATLGEPFGACAHQLGFLTLQQLADLSLYAYQQRRTFNDCLVQDQTIDPLGLAEMQLILLRAVRQAPAAPLQQPASASATSGSTTNLQADLR